MNIGFTGTRHGMNEAQLGNVRRYLRGVIESGHQPVAHHGDCVGADAQFHSLALELGFIIAIHPPTHMAFRAFCKGAVTEYPEKSYRLRNREIVDCSQLLLVAPVRNRIELRSGTWQTQRFAKQKEVDHVILWPNGGVDEHRYLPTPEGVPDVR